MLPLTISTPFNCTSLCTACGTTSTSGTTSQSTTGSVTSTISTQSTTTMSVTSTQAVTTTFATTTAQAKWWETKWGMPEYGGTITTGSTNIATNFDPYNWQYGGGQQYEPLWIVDPTLERNKEIDLTGDWTLYTNWKGNLAESWEWEDAKTLVVHLRQDVYWQDKEPVNGRQFVADDIVWHFDRVLGTGNGFTSANPYYAARYGTMQKVTARDTFTVVFAFGFPSVFVNSEAIIDQTLLQYFECREVYEIGQPISEGSGINSALNDWHNAVGTGPFILTDVVSSSSVTYSKNPDYWAYDERYPEYKLPYVDTVKTIFISDTSTSLAALRTGKIDIMQNITWQQAETLEDIGLLSEIMPQPGQALCLRSDREPFNDITVRKAMQLAIDLPAIAEGYYGGRVSPDPVGLVNHNSMPGFTIPFDEWDQDLKDEYSYNPTKAKQLLTDAGYPNGFKVTCDAFSDGSSDLELLIVLQSYLSEISVDMTIAPYQSATLMDMLGAHKHDSMVGWTVASVMPPLMGMKMYVTTKQVNALLHGDTTYDEMVEACQTAATVEEAQKLVSEVDQYFLRNHWMVLTFLNTYYTYWQPYLKGYAGEKALTVGYYARYWIDKD